MTIDNRTDRSGLLNARRVLNDDHGFADRTYFQLDSQSELVACIQHNISYFHRGESVPLRRYMVAAGGQQRHDVRASFVGGGMTLQRCAEVKQTDVHSGNNGAGL